MASKKLILGIISVAAIGYYVWDKQKKEGGNSSASSDNKTQRWLSDAESLAYLKANPDVEQHYGVGNIQGGKDHFYYQGYTENRNMA